MGNLMIRSISIGLLAAVTAANIFEIEAHRNL